MTAKKPYENTLYSEMSIEGENFNSISAMNNYSVYSFEELRHMDYTCISIAKTYAPIINKEKSPKNEVEGERTHCPICLEELVEVHILFKK